MERYHALRVCFDLVGCWAIAISVSVSIELPDPESERPSSSSPESSLDAPESSLGAGLTLSTSIASEALEAADFDVDAFREGALSFRLLRSEDILSNAKLGQDVD